MFNPNSETIQRGRKKVFSATQKLELLLPNGKSDGFLEEDDAIYVVKAVKIKGIRYLKFKVIKFADSKKENKIYTAERKYFKPYFEKKSNVDGGKTKKNKYTVPLITSISGGVLGALLAKKYDKSILVFGLGGMILGSLVGIYLLKQKEK